MAINWRLIINENVFFSLLSSRLYVKPCNLTKGFIVLVGWSLDKCSFSQVGRHLSENWTLEGKSLEIWFQFIWKFQSSKEDFWIVSTIFA
jgi:hypothetical protein